mmetsp:Transcript_98350/g.165604  ORF Transcript_98350/g.165604 Transcript_98350/m.165604 type:complete len:245 (-) Transcript_98350:2375-3109(-)
MSDHALDRVRQLLGQMGYSNVSEDVLLDIWNASQGQLLQGRAARGGYQADDGSRLETASECSTTDSNAYTNEQKERLFQRYSKDVPRAQETASGPSSSVSPATSPCTCPECMGLSSTAAPALQQAESPQRKVRGSAERRSGGRASRRSVGMSPLTAADVTELSEGLGLDTSEGGFPVARNQSSVIYAMDPYGSQRVHRRVPKSDPVAKYHQMQQLWKNDKFLSQADRRQLMWDMRVTLAHSASS